MSDTENDKTDEVSGNEDGIPKILNAEGPRTRQSNSLPGTPLYSRQDSQSNKNKRKAVDSPPNAQDLAAEEANIEIIEAVHKVSNLITNLYNKIKTYGKTRKDIREDTESLQNLNRTLLEGLVLQKLGVLKVNTEQVVNIQSETVQPQVQRLPRVRYFCERCTKELDQEEEERKDIRSKLKDALNYDEGEYLQFVNKPWPESVYERTKEVEGNPVNTKEGDVLYFVKEKGEDTTLMSIVQNRYPEVIDILTDETEKDERVQYLECTVSTKKKTNKRRVHIVETRGETDLREILLHLNENIIKDVKRLTIAVSVPESRQVIRKSMEILFADELEWEVEFFVPKKTVQSDIFIDRRERRPEAVIVKTNVSTYAETLKNIRAVINPEDMGVGIKTVKLTKDKNVIIETEPGKAEMLHREIATKVIGVESRVTGNTTAVIILDIDASISGKEIAEYIKKETKEYDTDVKSLRTAKSGTQVAIVSMPTKTAETLISRGDIKIGWTRCRVKQKIDVIRCFNCLKMGHHSEVCKEPKEVRRCLNCAQPGHLSKDCIHLSYCSTCEITGHRTDSSSCPSFRKLLKQIENRVSPEGKTSTSNQVEKSGDLVTAEDTSEMQVEVQSEENVNT